MLKLATVFSGIGSVEQALKRMGINHSLTFACDNGDVDLKLFDRTLQKEYLRLKTLVGKKSINEEDLDKLRQLERLESEEVERIKDYVFSLPDKNSKKEYVDNLYSTHSTKTNYVQATYCANYPIKDTDFHQDIRFLDARDYDGEVDLLVGGSPCQSFSSVGAQRGLDDTRGTLFYEFARIIRDCHPSVFIYENVRGLTTHDEGRTWDTIRYVFEDDLHYRITEPQILNASDYGVPQTRRRLFVIGIRDDIDCRPFYYPEPVPLRFTMQDFLEENCAYGCFGYNDDGSLRVENKPGHPHERFNLTPKVRDYVLSSGTKNFRTSTKTDMAIARTLLKTMTQHHRAGVDNYITIGYEPDGTKMLRALTDRECLRLMGYPDSFKIVVGPMQIYRQAGNSIVVDVMMAVLRSILNTGVFDNNITL